MHFQREDTFRNAMKFDVFSKSLNTIAAINAGKTSAEIVAALSQFIQPFGFNSILITGLPAFGLRKWQHSILYDGWPAEWAQRYQEMGHFTHDPCVSQCRNIGKPFLWRELQVNNMPVERARVMHEATEFGLHDGLCVPIHTPFRMPAVVTASGAALHLEDADVPMIEMAFVHAFRALLGGQIGPVESTFPPTKSELTPRERETLSWVAEGKSAEDVACILGISRYTVERHLTNIREKLDAINTTQAVVEALRQGKIHP